MKVGCLQIKRIWENKNLILVFIFTSEIPRCIAVPGQSVANGKQAPNYLPCTKNQFNIVVQISRPHQILS